MKIINYPFKYRFIRIWLGIGLAFIWLFLTADQAPAQPGDSLWHAAYWNNTSFSGPPVLEREENRLNFNWGVNSPHPDVNADNFAIRWTGSFNFEPATYRFTAGSDDGIRVWVDGDLLIDAWSDHPLQTFTGDKNLRGGYHQIVVEYYEREGGAIVEFWWAPAPPPNGQTWRGEYFNNPDLQGEPDLVRQDPEIGFNWDGNPPGAGIQADKFSVRWTRTLDLPAGYYWFTMLVDDGGRLWVNGRLLIDAWQIQSPRQYSANIYLPGGAIPLKMEYFDNLLGAVAHLTWQQTTAQTNTWRGEYFNGIGFKNEPVLVRQDPAIDFRWGNSSPAPRRLGVDRFSVRWTRLFDLEPGTYQFTLTSDDGVRAWVNDRLVVDGWREQAAQTYSNWITIHENPIMVRIEYFENRGRAQIQLDWQRIAAAGQGQTLSRNK